MRTIYADLRNISHIGNMLVTKRKPRCVGLSEWAVEGSNLRPWD